MSISSNTGGLMNAGGVGALISQTTEQTIGIRISPHLFRTAGATTAAEARGDMPHLASALLGHKHPCITVSSLAASRRYAELVQKYGSASNTEISINGDAGGGPAVFV